LRHFNYIPNWGLLFLGRYRASIGRNMATNHAVAQ
jgi:hypothetical protein